MLNYINDDKDLFDRLEENKIEIENALGVKMIWDRLDNSKASRIKYNIKGLNFDNHSNYDELMNRIIDITVKIRDVFKRYI